MPVSAGALAMRISRLLALAALLPWVLVTPAGAQLQAEWLTPKTTFTEGRTFTVRLRVTNNTFGTMTGVGIQDVEVTGTGHADLWSWPTPSVKDLAPLQSAVFKLRLRAELPGDLVVSALARAESGATTGPVPTGSLLIRPRKVRRTATTDAWGAATLRLGKTRLRVRLVDEDTGHPLAGLSLSASPIAKSPRAHLLLVADPRGRVPAQWIQVRGLPGINALPAPPGEEPSPDLPPAEPALTDPLDLPVFAGDGPFGVGPTRTVVTSRLGPSAQDKVSDDRYAEAWLRAAKGAAKAASKGQLALPPELGVDLPEVTAISFDPLEVPDGLVAIREAVESLTSTGAVGALVMTGVGGTAATSPVASIDLLDPTIASAQSHALATADELRLQSVRWGEASVVLVHPWSMNKKPANPTPSAHQSFLAVHLVGPGVVPQGALSPPVFSGTFTLESTDVLGRQLVTIFGTAATDDLIVPSGLYTATARRPFHEPWFAPVASADDAVQILDVFQQVSTITSGALLTTDALEHLPPLQGAATETVWVGPDQSVVPCDGEESLLFFGDPDVGEVVGTMALSGSGCGAGWLVGLCGRRQTAPVVFSTDCGGKLPASAPINAALSPED